MFTGVLIAGGLLAVMGAAFGVLLGFAAKKFAVESDPRVAEIASALPGANCGGCGFAGCANLAEAIVKGEAPVDACPVGKSAVAAKVAEVMGVEFAGGGSGKVAVVMCRGGHEQCGTRFEYSGIATCQAANMLAGGAKACKYGCLGLGSCVAACPFGAIHMSPSGVPEVDVELCTACGKCVSACPRHVIKLASIDRPVQVCCVSHAKGPEVRKTCQVGCIGCGICAKNCPAGAIEVQDFLAVIDPEKCTSCGACIEKCPMKTITKGMIGKENPETA